MIFIPAVAVIVAGYIGYRLSTKRKMKARERQIFEEAFMNLKEPRKLRAFAQVFANEGFKKEAELLNKRASLREQPADVIKSRRAAFDTALTSQDADKVDAMANKFIDVGAVAAGAALKKYAATLRAS